ncbi:MAG: tripartite tricarboxylate transporter permease, partial [Bacillota bacterium]
MIQDILSGLAVALSPMNLLATVVGAAIGIIMGAFPGLDCTVAAALFIPVTYALEPHQAILLLVGLYGGAVYGGQIPAILFRIPGAPEAVVTTLDGYPMAQQGKAGKALGLGLFYSVFGNVFGGIVLLLLAPLLASMALGFGPAEYFALGVLGMTAIAGLGGKSPIKSLVSGLFGLLLATVGMDQITGMERFT